MTNTPHDALAKLTFSRPELAAEEILYALGPKLAARIDPKSIRQVPGSFVSEDMKDRESDMLYEARLDGRDVLLYALVECQSTPDRWMPLRVLGYKVGIWENLRRRKPRAGLLPVILAVVVHHGEKPWRWSTAFEKLFDLPEGSCDELKFHIPHCGFILDDFAAHSEAELRARPASAHLLLVILALQYARTAPSLGELLIRLLDLIQELSRSEPGRAALREVFCYLTQVRGRHESADFAVVAAALQASNEEDLMETIADMWMSQGRQEGQHKIILRMLRGRFGELPAEAIRRVATAGGEQLESWADRLLSARTLDEVFAGS